MTEANRRRTTLFRPGVRGHPDAAVLTQQGDVSPPDSGFDAESFDLRL